MAMGRKVWKASKLQCREFVSIFYAYRASNIVKWVQRMDDGFLGMPKADNVAYAS